MESMLEDTFLYVNSFYHIAIFYHIIYYMPDTGVDTLLLIAFSGTGPTKTMAPSDKLLNDLKWNTRQRLEYIELMAYYTGAVSRSDVARAFGISDAAATKDLKLYSELAPANLSYKQSVFGFVPGKDFEEVFADLSPANALPLIASNLPTMGGPSSGLSIYGITVDRLPLPTRLPPKEVLSQIVRAIKGKKKLQVAYHSLTDRDSEAFRLIEPHSLIDTGLRWHVRAYNLETYDFRDFVLSRFSQAQLLEEDAESGAQYDDDWVELIKIELAPHPDLNEQKRASLLLDYGAGNDVIEINVRRALVGYLLQRLTVDTTKDHSLNPNAYQLVITNREEIEPFAGWALQ